MQLNALYIVGNLTGEILMTSKLLNLSKFSVKYSHYTVYKLTCLKSVVSMVASQCLMSGSQLAMLVEMALGPSTSRSGSLFVHSIPLVFMFFSNSTRNAELIYVCTIIPQHILLQL